MHVQGDRKEKPTQLVNPFCKLTEMRVLLRAVLSELSPMWHWHWLLSSYDRTTSQWHRYFTRPVMQSA
eukprot:scaffold188997_cov20-Tisochrysis_lutea.AAC.1